MTANILAVKTGPSMDTNRGCAAARQTSKASGLDRGGLLGEIRRLGVSGYVCSVLPGRRCIRHLVSEGRTPRDPNISDKSGHRGTPPAGGVQNIFPEECMDMGGNRCFHGFNGKQRLFMLKDYFGKLLFPRLHPSQYNQRLKIVAATISLGLFIAGGVTTVMILRGAVGR